MLRSLGFVDYLLTYVDVIIDIVFQRIKLWGVPKMQQIEGHDIRGLNCIVTGPTSGIGVETAKELARRGANVYLACRSKERGERVRESILSVCKATGKPVPKVEIVLVDMSSLSSVRKFISEWGKHKTPIHCLVNNAGIFNMNGPRQQTEDGFEAHLGTNYLGPYLLTMGLLPYIREGAQKSGSYGARIVNVSSKLHELGLLNMEDPNLSEPGSYSPLAAYAQSKLAQVTFSAELQERLPSSWRIQTFSLHPGNVLTDVTRDLPQIIRTLQSLTLKQILLTPEDGARSSIICAVSPDLIVRSRRTVGYVDSGGEPANPNPEAQDEQAQHWLWRFSADAVGLDPALDLPAVQ